MSEDHTNTDTRKKISPNRQIQRPLLVLFIIAIILGTFFRWSALGKKIYSHDEAYTSLYAAGYSKWNETELWNRSEVTSDDIRKYVKPDSGKSFFDTISAVASSNPHLAPLYFVLAHFWTRWFGSSPADIRSLSALISMLSLPGIYWLCLELFHSRTTAVIGVVLLSVSPFHILYAQDARPYSLLACITLYSSAALLYARRENTMLHWGIYSALLIIGFYSHLLFVVVAGAHGIYVVSSQEGRFNIKMLTAYGISLLVALLGFAPWIIAIYHHFDQVTSSLAWQRDPVARPRLVRRWVEILASPYVDIQREWSYLICIPVLLFYGFTCFAAFKRAPTHVWRFLFLLIGVTAAALIIPDLISGGMRSYQGRYFVPANTITILVVAYVLAMKFEYSNQPYQMRWYMVVCLLVTVSVLSAIQSMRAETWWNKALSPINPQVVYALNQSSHPLLFLSQQQPTHWGDLLALSYGVKSSVRFRIQALPEDIEVPDGYTDVFWFDPLTEHQEKLNRDSPYNVEMVVPGRLWRVVRKMR